MRKLQIADADLTRIAIQQEIRRSEESRYDHKLHGLLLVAAGHDCQQVAELFSEDRRTVQRWVNTFAHYGLEGLREGERSGRPRSLTARQWKSLERDLRKSPEEFNLGSAHWDGKTLSQHLRLHYNVELGIRQCQRMFKLMGINFRKSQPEMADAGDYQPAHSRKSPINKTKRG